MDCSYSGLVKKIQGDKSIGKEILIELSEEIIDYEKRIFEMQDNLKKMQSNQKNLRAGIDNAMKHLQIKTPLSIKIDNGIIVISDVSVTLQSNVL
jgi:5'-3' exonuclease